jgi:hypothetical protein
MMLPGRADRDAIGGDLAQLRERLDHLGAQLGAPLAQGGRPRAVG